MPALPLQAEARIGERLGTPASQRPVWVEGAGQLRLALPCSMQDCKKLAWCWRRAEVLLPELASAQYCLRS